MNIIKQLHSEVFAIKTLTGLILLLATYQVWALNPIQIENAIPPVAVDYQWDSAPPPASVHNIEGYADQASVNLGNTIKFYVNSNSARNLNYTLTVYRLGYYSGAGARRMTAPVTLASITQTIPTPDPVTGLVECNWTNPYSLTIPSTWTSGVYIATITGTTTGEGAYIPFVVKQESSTATYLFQTSDTTWHAYNAWGGKSLYAYNSTNSVPAVKVSYNRPHEGAGFSSLGMFELQTIHFLEKNGYDVTYQSDVDTHVGGSAQLLKHKAYLSVGHDEYWSKAMRDGVESAKAQGLSLGFFGANAAYWQIRFESSPITAAPNRTIVAYKEKAASDPIGNPILVTSKWRDPLYANRPENALIGVMYSYDPVNSNIVVSDAAHWVYTGTGLQNGSTLTGLLGYEIDSYFSNGFAPAGLQLLAHSVGNAAQGIYGDMSVYSQTCSLAPCVNASATVFATGSMQWAWGLDSTWTSVNLENPAAKQITHNVLARMVNPGASLPATPPNSVTNTNVVPNFVGGTAALTVAQNSTPVDLKPNLHVSDSDTSQTETWSQSVAPLHGTLVFTGATASSGSADITPGGTITYQPTAGYTGTDSFAVQASDGTASVTRTFSVTVNAAANIAPTFVGSTTALTVAQNSTPVDLKPNLHVSDSNVGQTETWSQSVAPLHGTLVFTGATASSGSADIAPGGTITYQPTAGYNGTDSFTIQVSDGAISATRVFTITVSASGIGPNLLINPSLELDQDANSQPDCWQFGGYGTNTATWTRTADAHSGSFAQLLQISSYTSGDRKLLSTNDASQSAGGCAPVVQAGATYKLSAYYKSTVKTSVVLLYLDATGVWQYWTNGPSLAATSVWTQMNFTTGALPTGARALSFGIAMAGTGTLTTDDYSFAQVLSTPPNNVAPAFVGTTSSITVAQNSTPVDLKPNLHVSDSDTSQTETWSQSVAPLHGTLVFTGATASSGSADITPGGTITYQPTAGYTGTDSFAVQASDGTASVTRTFSVTVNAAANIAPTFVGSTTALTVAQNSTPVDLKPNLHVSDSNVGQTETWSQSVAPLHGTLVFTGATASSGSADIAPGGTITYQPTAGYNGTDSFTIQVSDGAISATRVFTITVSASGIGPNLLINPSLELDQDANSQPDCWQFGGYGTNTATWTRTADAHSGSFAQLLQISSYTSGDRKLLSTNDASQSAGGCAPVVQAGATYKLSAYYKSTVKTSVVLLYLDATGVWQYWTNGPSLAATSVWTQMNFTTGALPTGARALSFGIAMAGTGTLTTDDYSFAQVLP